MSMREELKRIKNEKEAEEKRLDEQRKTVSEKKMQAEAKFDPMVRRLLDELGLVSWGKGKYQVGQLRTWSEIWDVIWIVRSVPVYVCEGHSGWAYQAFPVRLCFDSGGNPSHFLVNSGPAKSLLFSPSWQPEPPGKRVCLSESELEMALVKSFKDGPVDEYCYESSEHERCFCFLKT